MPYDAQKGDSARSVAYFFTYYDKEIKSLTKTFVRIDDMIDWDQEFYPSEKTLEASQRMIETQGNHNPFIEEEGLVLRAFCDMSEGKYSCD